MRARSHSKGFTLIELLVTIAIITVLIGILLPSLRRAIELGNRAVCASRQAGVFKALNAYAAVNRNVYPRYSATDTNSAICFQYPTRADSTYSPTVAAAIADSITAPFWAIVRDGSTSPKNFLCPSDAVSKEDTLLVNYTNTAASDLRATWDFNTIGSGSAVYTNSYSSMDMYDTHAGGNWNPTAGANWVLMGDSNNTDGLTASAGVSGTVHAYSKSSANLTADLIKAFENSKTHRNEGQNFAFGDGHVAFSTDPFVGPGGDNVYSHRTSDTTEARATTFVHNATAYNDHDAVLLLPIAQNTAPASGGGNPGGGDHDHDRDGEHEGHH